MEIKNISIQFTQKANLGNYEGCEVSVMLHATLDLDEPVDGAGELLMLQAKQIVYNELQEIARHHRKNPIPSVKHFLGGKEVRNVEGELF
jgi:hypothetical protein